jgi:hypothetical protein
MKFVNPIIWKVSSLVVERHFAKKHFTDVHMAYRHMAHLTDGNLLEIFDQQTFG